MRAEGAPTARVRKTRVTLAKADRTATNNKVAARVVRRARRATMLLSLHLATKMWQSR